MDIHKAKIPHLILVQWIGCLAFSDKTKKLGGSTYILYILKLSHIVYTKNLSIGEHCRTDEFQTVRPKTRQQHTVLSNHHCIYWLVFKTSNWHLQKVLSKSKYQKSHSSITKYLAKWHRLYVSPQVSAISVCFNSSDDISPLHRLKLSSSILICLFYLSCFQQVQCSLIPLL